MLIQIWEAFSNVILWGSLQGCKFWHISVIKDDCCIVACVFLFTWTSSSGWLGKLKVQHSLHCWCCNYSCLNAFLRWHFPYFVFSLNKCVHSDALFYRTNGCWWLFEFNSAKVRTCVRAKSLICLVRFLINVKTKINCKTESYFFIMFSMVGRIWIHDGPHAGRGLRTTALNSSDRMACRKVI